MQRIELIFPFLLVCCTLTVLMSGCAKENLRDQSTSGTVTNLTTDEAIIGVKVQLIEEHIPAEPFSPITRTVIQSTTTDVDGTFEFDPVKKQRRNRTYFVEIEESPYLADHGWVMADYERVKSSSMLLKGETEGIELSTVPFGGLALKVTNHSPTNIYVLLQLSNSKGNFRELSREVASHETSTRPATMFMAGEFDVLWKIVSNGDTMMYEDSFIIDYAEDQTLEFEYPIHE